MRTLQHDFIDTLDDQEDSGGIWSQGKSEELKSGFC